jgi:hypothetical protein
MQYLVIGSGGPGFSSAEEASGVLENLVLPTFEQIIRLEMDKRILAGGLPVGERTLVFIIQAESNGELDEILRSLPLWGVMEWEVTPLQSFECRKAMERSIAQDLVRGPRRRKRQQKK